MSNWKTLNTIEGIDAVIDRSMEVPCVIYKHSTTCPVNHAAQDRLENKWDELKGIEMYYLDLLEYRSVSNAIAEKFGVTHQSPQVLLIMGGECVYDESHFKIEADKIAKEVKKYQ